MESGDSIIEKQSKVLKVFGSELTEKMNALMKVNEDETIEDFILNSAFEFLDELEWKYKAYISKNDKAKHPRSFKDSKTNHLADSEINEIAKMIENIDTVIKIHGNKTRKAFIYDAANIFLDRIDRWFDYEGDNITEPSEAFHFDSEVKEIQEHDSKYQSQKKFQIIMHKEFLSYIHKLFQ